MICNLGDPMSLRHPVSRTWIVFFEAPSPPPKKGHATCMNESWWQDRRSNPIWQSNLDYGAIHIRLPHCNLDYGAIHIGLPHCNVDYGAIHLRDTTATLDVAVASRRRDEIHIGLHYGIAFRLDLTHSYERVMAHTWTSFRTRMMTSWHTHTHTHTHKWLRPMTATWGWDAMGPCSQLRLSNIVWILCLSAVCPISCASWPVLYEQVMLWPHCKTLQHAATRCNTLQHAATHCNTLQHAATHCNTLQHAATRCNTL